MRNQTAISRMSVLPLDNKDLPNYNNKFQLEKGNSSSFVLSF